jgi:hypothetical protein
VIDTLWVWVFKNLSKAYSLHFGRMSTFYKFWNFKATKPQRGDGHGGTSNFKKLIINEILF